MTKIIEMYVPTETLDGAPAPHEFQSRIPAVKPARRTKQSARAIQRQPGMSRKEAKIMHTALIALMIAEEIEKIFIQDNSRQLELFTCDKHMSLDQILFIINHLVAQCDEFSKNSCIDSLTLQIRHSLRLRVISLFDTALESHSPSELLEFYIGLIPNAKQAYDQNLEQISTESRLSA